MKTSLKSLLLAVLAGMGTLSAQAQTAPKIVVIDLAKVFEGYYQTKDQNDKLQADTVEAKKGLDALDKERTDLIAKFNDLVAKTKDNNLITAEAKAAAEQEAQKLANDIRAKQNDEQNSYNNLQNAFNQRMANYKELAIKDINKVAVDTAKKLGANLLIDKSNNTAFRTSSFIYIDPSYTDISDDVLATMNAGHPTAAPAASATSAPATGAQPAVTFPGVK